MSRYQDTDDDHSVLCQSLDYFSWFGAFSGSRTDRTAFEDTIQTGDFAELPIHYLYVASGNFDFALPGQVQDYQALLDIEPRLRSGVNTCFDVFLSKMVVKLSKKINFALN